MSLRERRTKAASNENAMGKTYSARQLTENGKVLSGEYKGARTITTKFGERTIHQIGNDAVYGTYQLNQIMGDIAQGTELTVKPAGETTEGERTMINWDVSVVE